MALPQCAICRWLATGGAVALLSGCGTFLSHDGPRADAPRIYSGVRLDWAAWQGDERYIERYRLKHPDYPVADMPLSFALDSLLLPLCIYRSIYQWLAVPPGGW
ncbi:MAG: YceK/YidQ family lipoprotein [Proteobacteria bacterium]|nr:YceK/YidQ family lipoprotein [Pseudomonadota bacterium]